MKKMIHLEEVRFLRDQGVTLSSIAEQLGVTVEAVEATIRCSTGYGLCTVCHLDVGVRTDGLIRVHGWVAGEQGNCPGSMRAPTPDTDIIDMPVRRPIDRQNVSHWLALAACQDADPETFFATNPAAALAICRDCAVAAECLDHAIATGSDVGVWGGLTEGERARLRRRGR